MDKSSRKINAEDQTLIAAAIAVIRKNFQEPRHTVGAAVLCASGRTYTGVNVDSCGYGPCAEPITLGAAISSGEREFRKIVAVNIEGKVMPPCGNCRQLLAEYAPGITVIMPRGGTVVKTTIEEILPDSYHNF